MSCSSRSHRPQMTPQRHGIPQKHSTFLRQTFSVLLWVSVFLWCQVVQAAEPSVAMVSAEALDARAFPGLATSISLDLRGMDVVEALKFLAAKGDMNIATSADVEGRVTLTLKNVTVRDALDIILVTNSLAIERRGTILYVLSGQAYEQLYGHRYGDPRHSIVLQLRYANPGQVGSLLGNIKSSVGRIVIDEPTATLALLDTPSVLAEMRELIERVDLPTVQRQLPVETRVFPLQFAKAEDVKPEIESLLTPDIGQLRLDKRSNALIITELPARMPQIETVLRAFDVRHRQVYIEASILSVTLRDEFDTGIDWTLVSESKQFPDVSITNALPIASDALNAIKLIVGTVAENDVTATLKALHAFGDTKVLSSPHISVLNNEEAKIHVGTREVYVTTTTTQTTGTLTVPEQVNFIDVGVRLSVTPVINDTGFITLKIRPEVSSVSELRPTASGNKVPIVSTSEAETRVMVKDGTTVLIGGLMKDETTLSKQKVPLLGDIPVLGVAFRNKSDRIKKTELVILMTPHLMSGEELLMPKGSTAKAN